MESKAAEMQQLVSGYIAPGFLDNHDRQLAWRCFGGKKTIRESFEVFSA